MAAAAVHGNWMEQHYRFQNKIGEGCCGSVYSVLPKKKSPFSLLRASKPCACKAAESPDSRQTLCNEAAIMRQLRGIDNVVALKKFHQDEAGGFLIMELCDCDLWEALRAGLIPRSEAHAVRLTLELARTIEAIHSRGVVHRDLKPDNILVTRDRRLKISDFGCAARCRDGETLSEPAGTARYAAPEIYRGSYGKQVDVYALGLILYSLVEGVYPFKNIAEVGGEELYPFLYEKALQGIDVAREYLEFTHASKDAREVILRMTCGDPSRRLSIDEVLRNPWLVQKEKVSKYL